MNRGELIKQFMQCGADWAGRQPPSAWAPGHPPKAPVKDMHVAVRTETGRILTGTLMAFYRGAEWIEAQAKYGRIIEWIPFGD
jgi:hypothetical protein